MTKLMSGILKTVSLKVPCNNEYGAYFKKPNIRWNLLSLIEVFCNGFIYV